MKALHNLTLTHLASLLFSFSLIWFPKFLSIRITPIVVFCHCVTVQTILSILNTLLSTHLYEKSNFSVANYPNLNGFKWPFYLFMMPWVGQAGFSPDGSLLHQVVWPHSSSCRIQDGLTHMWPLSGMLQLGLLSLPAFSSSLALPLCHISNRKASLCMDCPEVPRLLYMMAQDNKSVKTEIKLRTSHGLGTRSLQLHSRDA